MLSSGNVGDTGGDSHSKWKQDSMPLSAGSLNKTCQDAGSLRQVCGKGILSGHTLRETLGKQYSVLQCIAVSGPTCPDARCEAEV